MNPLLVIICTSNPQRDYLEETLAALRGQTAPVTAWELLVVDNASNEPLSGRLDLSWHPSARIVREEKLGVAHARHRAFREALSFGAGMILFVDDDNILERDYLARGLALAESWPQLGCWGGQLLPRYAAPPPAWISRYLDYLAIHPLSGDLWCNAVKSYSMVPPTAGCFVRGAVWRKYLQLIEQEPRRLALMRAEDMDLALTSIDLELGIGRFRDLKLTHIVPETRLTPGYIANLLECTAVGMGMMEYLRFRRIPRPARTSLIEKMLLSWRISRLPEPTRSINRADQRGRAAARRIVLAWQSETGAPSSERLQPAPVRA